MRQRPLEFSRFSKIKTPVEFRYPQTSSLLEYFLFSNKTPWNFPGFQNPDPTGILFQNHYISVIFITIFNYTPDKDAHQVSQIIANK